MSEGIKDKEEMKEEEEDGDDAINAEDLDRISVNPPVRRESKKTRTQRNKEKKKKMQVCWGDLKMDIVWSFFIFLFFGYSIGQIIHVNYMLQGKGLYCTCKE